MYITGGIGSTVDGEAFSFNYDLPNDLAYAETCASIGLVFFAKRMSEIDNKAEYSNVIEDGLRRGKVDLIVSVDSGTEEMHARIKEVKTYDKVWDNLRRYAAIQQNRELVKVKYIVIPGVNDTREEINAWLDRCVDFGIGYVIQEIESQWFYSRRDRVPQYIYDLFDYTKQAAMDRGLVYGEYERAAHMLAERREKEAQKAQNNG